MDKKGINLKPILAVIKVKEMLIAILLLISMSLVQLRNLKIYLIGLVTFLLVSRLNGNFQVGNLYYITVYNTILTCILFGVASAIVINLIYQFNI